MRLKQKEIDEQISGTQTYYKIVKKDWTVVYTNSPKIPDYDFFYMSIMKDENKNKETIQDRD